MRLLKEAEQKLVYEKIEKYIGDNLKLLLEREDQKYALFYHNDRLYYSPEKVMKQAANLPIKELISIGTCFGKFTKTHKFRLHITALDFLAPYAKYKIWLKPNAEQQFLYGNHILKSGIARITENTPQYEGIVIYNMADVPLGFGVSAKSTMQIRACSPLDIVVFHQADLGEYLRSEDIYL